MTNLSQITYLKNLIKDISHFPSHAFTLFHCTLLYVTLLYVIPLFSPLLYFTLLYSILPYSTQPNPTLPYPTLLYSALRRETSGYQNDFIWKRNQLELVLISPSFFAVFQVSLIYSSYPRNDWVFLTFRKMLLSLFPLSLSLLSTVALQKSWAGKWLFRSTPLSNAFCIPLARTRTASNTRPTEAWETKAGAYYKHCLLMHMRPYTVSWCNEGGR